MKTRLAEFINENNKSMNPKEEIEARVIKLEKTIEKLEKNEFSKDSVESIKEEVLTLKWVLSLF